MSADRRACSVEDCRKYADAVFGDTEQPAVSPVPGLSARWQGRFERGPAYRSQQREGPAGELSIEHLIERALDLPDQPEPGEFDRAVPVEPSSSAHVALSVVMGVVTLASVVMVELSSGQWSTFTLGDQTHESELALRFPTSFELESELEFWRNEPKNGPLPTIESTPESALVHVELVHEGKPLRSLACDPHDLKDAAIAIEEGGSGRSHYRIRGRPKGCAFRLEPGRYLLRLRAERLAGARAAGLEACQLELRFKRHLY